MSIVSISYKARNKAFDNSSGKVFLLNSGGLVYHVKLSLETRCSRSQSRRHDLRHAARVGGSPCINGALSSTDSVWHLVRQRFLMSSIVFVAAD
jgi:hypothetical protein